MTRDIDDSSENVLSEWSRRVQEPDPDASDPPEASDEGPPAWGTASVRDRVELTEVARESEATDAEESVADGPESPAEAEPEAGATAPAGEAAPADESGGEETVSGAPMVIELSHEHAAGELEIPDGYAVLEGEAQGGRRAVGVVVSRFNGVVTSKLLARALEELDSAGVRREAITVMVVPGAFELPLAATALAKTRRFACVVALGCVIRGDTPHFDYVASEAASGLQLAALETGVPVSFGVLTLERVEQADPRVDKGAEAVRSALEMADVFSQLRAAAAR